MSAAYNAGYNDAMKGIIGSYPDWSWSYAEGWKLGWYIKTGRMI